MAQVVTIAVVTQADQDVTTEAGILVVHVVTIAVVVTQADQDVMAEAAILVVQSVTVVENVTHDVA